MNLRLLQMADSALPISGYTHSWGLEAAIANGTVRDPESLERWTSSWLRLALGPMEGVIVAAAFRSMQTGEVQQLVRWNELLETSVVPPSIRRASREMGDQLLALGATWAWSAEEVWVLRKALPQQQDGWHHAVAFGLMGAIGGAPLDAVLTAYLHQAALGIVSAGVRAIPVGHTHGQQVLAYLHNDISELAATLADCDPETAGSGCPHYEVLCDDQTRLYARMFRS